MNPWFALPMSAVWFKRLVRDMFNAMVLIMVLMLNRLQHKGVRINFSSQTGM